MDFRKKALLIFAVVFTLSCITAITAAGAEIRVPEDYATIQEAIDAAASGDTIIVGPGTYEEDLTISGKSDITLKSSEGAENTSIRGSILIEDSNGITLDGFTITAPEETNGINVRGEVSGLTITNNVITECGRTGIDFQGEYSNVLIENNDITYNGFDGINLGGTGSNIAVRGNNISYNGQVNARGTGIRIGPNVTDLVIEENVMEGNAFANIHPT